MSGAARARDRRRATLLRWAARRAAKRQRRTVAWYVREIGRYDWSNATISVDSAFGPDDWRIGELCDVLEAQARVIPSHVPTHLALCSPTLATLTSMLQVASAGLDFSALPLVLDDTVPLGHVEQRTGPRRRFELVALTPFIEPTPVEPELLSWGDSVIARLRPVVADLDRAQRAACIFAIDDAREVPGSAAGDGPVAGVDG